MRTETTNLPARVPVLAALPAPDNAVAESIAPLEEITVSTDLLRAARLCTEKPKPYGGRAWLQGVYIHRTDDGFVRIVGSDGVRLLVANAYREFADRSGAAWLKKGVIIPADQLEARLALLTKAGGKCVITYAEGAPHVELGSPMGDVSFRLKPIDASFPDYSPIMSGWRGGFSQGEQGDFHPTAFDVKHLKQVTDVANRLGSESIDAYAAPIKPTGKTDVSSEPAVFTFGKGVALFVRSLPRSGTMAAADRVLLAPAVKASIGALKAHETRNRKAASKAAGKAKEALLAIADDFKARIESLLKRAGDGTVAAALPAPQPPPPPVVNDAIRDDATVSDEGPTPEQIAAVEKPQKVKPKVVRQGARKAKR